MPAKWLAVVRSLFATPEGTPVRRTYDLARFGIGFCPRCKRLRGATSLRCEYCGSTRPVAPDA
jgi:hypothetical protein